MSVVCSKCGEELMGAVNRCWKCGSTFARTETAKTSTDQRDRNTTQDRFRVPPIRRSPVLERYLFPAILEHDEPIQAIIEEESADEVTESQEAGESFSETKFASFLRRWLPDDWTSVGGSVLAIFACIASYYSIVGVFLSAIAVMLNVYLINWKRSPWRWIGFALATLSLMFALAQTVSTIYFWGTGVSLSTALFGP